jgi:hypothetical protein
MFTVFVHLGKRQTHDYLIALPGSRQPSQDRGKMPRLRFPPTRR